MMNLDRPIIDLAFMKRSVFACMVNLFPTQNVVQFLKNKHKTRLN